MSAWTERAPVETVAPILAAARAAGEVSNEDAALVFHDIDRMRGRITELRAAFPEHDGARLFAEAVRAAS